MSNPLLLYLELPKKASGALTMRERRAGAPNWPLRASSYMGGAVANPLVPWGRFALKTKGISFSKHTASLSTLPAPCSTPSLRPNHCTSTSSSILSHSKTGIDCDESSALIHSPRQPASLLPHRAHHRGKPERLNIH